MTLYSLFYTVGLESFGLSFVGIFLFYVSNVCLSAYLCKNIYMMKFLDFQREHERAALMKEFNVFL